LEDLGEPGAEKRLWGEGRDDVEEVYNGCGEVLLLAARRRLAKKCKESSEIRCWGGFGVLLFQGRLDCSQDNGCLECKSVFHRVVMREKDWAKSELN
jgi:hypothetical protein